MPLHRIKLITKENFHESCRLADVESKARIIYVEVDNRPTNVVDLFLHNLYDKRI